MQGIAGARPRGSSPTRSVLARSDRRTLNQRKPRSSYRVRPDRPKPWETAIRRSVRRLVTDLLVGCSRYTASFSSLAGRNAIFLLALILMAAPVAGSVPFWPPLPHLEDAETGQTDFVAPLQMTSVSVTKSPSTASACFFAISWLSANAAARCLSVMVAWTTDLAGAAFLAFLASHEFPRWVGLRTPICHGRLIRATECCVTNLIIIHTFLARHPWRAAWVSRSWRRSRTTFSQPSASAIRRR